MSVLTDRTSGTPKAGRSKKSGAPGLPQINLLPPEVRSSRALSRTKRWLVIAVAVSVVAVGGGFGYGLLERAAATSELNEAQAQADALQAQADKYAEVPRVLGEVAQVTKARSTAMTDDVQWRAYLDAITAVLPAGVSIDSLSITGPDPIHSATATSADVLNPAGVGTIAFSARSMTIPDAAAWLDALATVPGVHAPRVSSVTATATESGTTYYTVAMTASLGSEALSHRFDQTAGK